MSEASEGTWGCRRQDNGRARFENAGHASASLQAHGQPQRLVSCGGPCCHLCAWRACLIAVVPPRSTTGRGRGGKLMRHLCSGRARLRCARRALTLARDLREYVSREYVSGFRWQVQPGRRRWQQGSVRGARPRPKRACAHVPVAPWGHMPPCMGHVAHFLGLRHRAVHGTTT